MIHHQSLFISLEGIEGSGKSSQINFIKSELEKKGYEVLTLREPGGTTFGENLRQAILEQKSKLHPLAEMHLFLASRTQLLHEKILPFLSQPKTAILIDRYLDSSLVYQGVARHLGINFVLEQHQVAPLNNFPTRTYYLKISLETSKKRQAIRNNKKDYFELELDQFHEKLIRGFNEVSELFSSRIKTIDAEKDINQVSAEILADLETLIHE